MFVCFAMVMKEICFETSDCLKQQRKTTTITRLLLPDFKRPIYIYIYIYIYVFFAVGEGTTCTNILANRLYDSEGLSQGDDVRGFSLIQDLKKKRKQWGQSVSEILERGRGLI